MSGVNLPKTQRDSSQMKDVFSWNSNISRPVTPNISSSRSTTGRIAETNSKHKNNSTQMTNVLSWNTHNEISWDTDIITQSMRIYFLNNSINAINASRNLQVSSNSNNSSNPSNP